MARGDAWGCEELVDSAAGRKMLTASFSPLSVRINLPGGAESLRPRARGPFSPGDRG